MKRLSLPVLALSSYTGCEPKAACFVYYYKSHTHQCVRILLSLSWSHHMEKGCLSSVIWDISLWQVSQSAWRCSGFGKSCHEDLTLLSPTLFLLFLLPICFQPISRSSLPPHKSCLLGLFLTLSWDSKSYQLPPGHIQYWNPQAEALFGTLFLFLLSVRDFMKASLSYCW